MAYNIGLNVVEVDGTGAPAIVGASTSVGAFNILTMRGVPNWPSLVTSFRQFTDQFGAYFTGGYGAYMVKGFFDNGGQFAYINRVVATYLGKTVATFDTTQSVSENPTFVFSFRATDPGTLTITFYDTHGGKYEGTADVKFV